MTYHQPVVQKTEGATVVVSTVSAPVIWNSIVYGNGPAALGADLSGFAFGPPAVGVPTVNSSDFCGGPWAVFGVACGTQGTPTGYSAGCISSPPNFVLPAAPNFVLVCGGGCGPAPCPPCAGPCPGSACIDAGDQAGPGVPAMPLTDTNGAPRAVSLNSPALVPDMGAVEKQACIP